MQFRNAAAQALGPGHGRRHERSPGMERIAATIRLVGQRRQAQMGAEQLDQPLGVVQIEGAVRPVPGRRLRVPGDQQPQAGPLSWSVTHPTVALTDLEQGHIVATLPLVEGEDGEEAPDEVPAQDRMLGRKRIADRNRGAGRRPADDEIVVAGPLELRLFRRRNQGVGDHFAQPRAGEEPANADPHGRSVTAGKRA